jgi:hypothetical protein
MTVAAIHQPNFFPWLGYFAKLARADVFVFLDGVDFPKNSWVNRVKLNIGDEARWITCPIDRSTIGGRIADVVMRDENPWRRKMMTALETNYGRAAHADEMMPWARSCLDAPETNLASFNIAAIESIARGLDLRTRLVRQTSLDDPRIAAARGSTRLAVICQALNASVYLAGDGADAYEDETVYAAEHLELRRLGFVQPTYAQGGANRAFQPGLSILDALFHLGWAGVRELLDRTRSRADNQVAR